MRSESLGQYHDLLVYVAMSAPDHFPNKVSDQATLFRESFEDLRSDFGFVERQIKNERLSRILREMLEMSFEAYQAGNNILGARVLLELEGLVWKSRSGKVKHAVEAELRAFGALELYKDVRVSQYPYEGTLSDLSSDQKVLLDLAELQCRRTLREGATFKLFCWAMRTDGAVFRISAEPASDITEAPKPLEKSWKRMDAKLRDLAAKGLIRASVVVSPFTIGGVPQSLTYRLDQRDGPRISVHSSVHKTKSGEVEYSQKRFHLNDPDIFPDIEAQPSLPPDVPAAASRRQGRW